MFRSQRFDGKENSFKEKAPSPFSPPQIRGGGRGYEKKGFPAMAGLVKDGGRENLLENPRNAFAPGPRG